MKRMIALTAAATLAMGSAAFADNMIDTSDVQVDGSTVTFADVTADQAGYLVIHETKDGKPVAPASIGHVAIDKGDNADVAVTTDMPLEPGTDYVAMLHSETNDNDTYDFAEGSTDVDTPVMVDEKPVVETFTAPEAK